MTPLITFLLFSLCAVHPTQKTFPEFIIRVNTAPEQRRQFMVDSMLATVPGYPYAESDSSVWFLYQGNITEAFVAGDMNSWSNTLSPLQQLSTTDLWYHGEKFAPDTRVDYKLVIDGNWILDPRNPFTVSGGFGPNSELRMPGYTPPYEILHHEGVARGTVVDTSFTSSTLNNTRDVKIYLPAGYAGGQDSYPVVLFHDGPDYLSLGSAATVLDNLIHEQRIPPCIAVFVPAINRTKEYAGSQIDQFTDFIVNVVMRRVDASYRTRRDPEARAMIGSSNGGNIALYIAMKHPEAFGCAGAQSSNIIASISNTFVSGPTLPLRLYLDLGTYDIEVLIPLVHTFVPILKSKGYEFLFNEFNEGHSWGSWRAHIDDALEFFFTHLLSADPPPSPASEGFNVGPSWPNPATEQVTIHFVLTHRMALRISLCDALGRTLRILHDQTAHAGSQQLTLSLAGVRPGMYFLRVDAGGITQVRPISVR